MQEHFIQYSQQENSDILKSMNVDGEQGLSSDQIKQQREKFGSNILSVKEVKWWHVLGRQFTSPFIYLLLLAAIVSYFLGEVIDSLFILFFIVINTFLGFYQEFRSENILKLLKKYLVSFMIVIRDGVEVKINRDELVMGDIVLLQLGDIVPADIRLLESEGLEVNESILTGEAEAVFKTTEKLKGVKEVYEAKNMVFTGTSVVAGRGRGIVVSIGKETSFGEVNTMAVETKRESGFDKGMKKVSGMILKVIGFTFLFVFVLKILFPQHGGSTYIEFLLFSIALAVSVIPEGLPLVITFTLSHGAKRLANNKVVIKRLSSIEDLGGIEMLCVDKTGTLTENKMRIADFYSHDEQMTLFSARLAGNIFGLTQNGSNTFDEALCFGMKKKEKDELARYKKIAELAFDPVRRRNAVVVKRSTSLELIVRGAPEEILPLCSKGKSSGIKKFLEDEGKKGHRVLALARKTLKSVPKDIPSQEKGLEFVGCVSFYDPLKKTTYDALEKAQALGVQIKILTGDGKDVSLAIGKQLELVTDADEVMSGEEFEKLTDKQKKIAVEKCHIFARVSPQEKYEIIELLRKKYEVGFLGEGINDAPALKIANIGMVVENASDIAREAADIILLNKSLLTIVEGIEEGRKVFQNNLKYLKATMASNFGNFYAVVAASFLAKFLPMLPVQLLLLNLLSDVPMMAIAEDTVDKRELEKPLQYNVKDIATICFLLGAVSTVFDFIFFGLFYHLGPEILRTNWFIGSVITELIFLFSIRTVHPFYSTKRPSSFVFLLSVIAATTAILLPLIPWTRQMFGFVRPTLIHLGVIACVLFIYFVCTEKVKLWYYKSKRI